MTLMRYEPFNLLSQFQREVNRLLDASRLQRDGSSMNN